MPSRKTLIAREKVEEYWLKEFTCNTIAQLVGISRRSVLYHLKIIRQTFAKWNAEHEQEAFGRQLESLNLAIRTA